MDNRPAGAAEAAEVPRPTASEKPVVTFDDFQKLDLRVAEIVQAEEIPGADKLLKLTVSLGDQRTVVAGIKGFYAPQDLVGKKVVVVANLAPRTLRGVESRGMVLAANESGMLRLITVDGEIPAGAIVR